MKQIALAIAMLIGFCMNACTQHKYADSPSQNTDTTSTKTQIAMTNLVSIIEIPTADLQRAIEFYEAILEIKIDTAEMEGVKMGMFPSVPGGVFVQLINGNDYKVSPDGTTVYLNGGNDLQHVADRIQANGGRVVVPKTAIGPDMGYFAIFIDTEGNKVGLHSLN